MMLSLIYYEYYFAFEWYRCRGRCSSYTIRDEIIIIFSRNLFTVCSSVDGGRNDMHENCCIFKRCIELYLGHWVATFRYSCSSHSNSQSTNRKKDVGIFKYFHSSITNSYICHATLENKELTDASFYTLRFASHKVVERNWKFLVISTQVT